MGSTFFGLPRSDDPAFAKKIGEKNLNLLVELRYVAKEVGYQQAQKMPVEIRRWWIDQMQKEAQQRKDDYDELSGGVRTMDVK